MVKFDVVIGNPPYQEEANGSSSKDMPIYHRFMEEAYKVGGKVLLITPARFLSNAGGTPCVLQDLSTQYCKEKVHTFAPEIFL